MGGSLGIFLLVSFLLFMIRKICKLGFKKRINNEIDKILFCKINN